jgi:hypothetical protein
MLSVEIVNLQYQLGADRWPSMLLVHCWPSGDTEANMVPFQRNVRTGGGSLVTLHCETKCLHVEADGSVHVRGKKFAPQRRTHAPQPATSAGEVTAVPHPNEHIRLMGPLAHAIWQSLLRRPVQLIRLDAPLLVISDEPVIVDTDEHVRHLPECSLTQGQLRRRQDRYGVSVSDRDSPLITVRSGTPRARPVAANSWRRGR